MDNMQGNTKSPNKGNKKNYEREQFYGELLNGHLYYWISEVRYDTNHKSIISMCDNDGRRKFSWGIDKGDHRLHPNPGDYIIEAMLRRGDKVELRIAKIVYINTEEREIYADIIFHRNQCNGFPRFKSTKLKDCLNNVRVRLYTDNRYAPYCNTKLLMSV